MTAQDSSAGGAAPPQRSPRHITLDGRTLEGGGQLVRNALALAALTGRPVTIDHVRGNRGGKTGLKASHAAAVKLLGDISGSKVTGGQVGSQIVTFEPPVFEKEQSATDVPAVPNPILVPLSSVSPKPEYNIILSTPGSVFLIFQAIYPYLLWVGSQPGIEKIRVNITGGTNGTNSPTYDYATQVMLPNFKKLGLPSAEVILHKRGWSNGVVDMGSVSFHISPLDPSAKLPSFPPINLMVYDRGKITRVDITILAPDVPMSEVDRKGQRQGIRHYCEREIRRTLRKSLKKLDPSLFDQELLDNDDYGDHVPITLAQSEPTSHASRFYILLVADTREGFKIGYDALGTTRAKPNAKLPGRSKHKKDKKGSSQNNRTDMEHIDDFIEGCVQGFIDEISGLGASESHKKRSPLDQYMRDQIVVFEELGRLSSEPEKNKTPDEDARYWTLHTKTSQWVCREMLPG
ncbi:hypothetical protein N7533_006084 [Penicillium manginii]|jgi:RNA 3'-terminal phosphate cyclase (ATP)|uniref:uncharacterized protein n=1 Tax=Penicillium manginii TaxID=203109 RepID=UPI002546D3C8|nr:uncharacterized protein N7533_006084 [Penicillium manginii]KAJ5756541.1 hypothetical protein N7533_006084 [Penicillium manginii]